MKLPKRIGARGRVQLAARLVSFACFTVGTGYAATWTGAADACWTNAANWAEGQVPGQYYAPDGTLAGAAEMVATFGAGAVATEIDLDGLYSIGKVTVTGADAPRYTFGTSTTQVLPIEAKPGSSLNQFVVHASVVRAPVIKAIFAFGSGVGNNGTVNVNVYFYNNSSDTVVVNDFGYMSGTKRILATFAGTGAFAVNGGWVTATTNPMAAGQSYINIGAGGGVTFNKSFTFPGIFRCNTAGSKMTIADGVTITTTGGWGDFGNPPFYIDGPGTLSVAPGKYAQCYADSDIYLNCRLAQNSTPGADRGVHLYGQGAYHISNTGNTLSGTLQYCGQNAQSAFVFDKIGRIGETGTPLANVSTIRANNYLKVVFTGSEPDATDRVFEIGSVDVANNNNTFKNKQHSFVVEQAGSASLTIESTPSLRSAPADGIHKFTLTGNGSADGIWSGVLADGASTKLQVTKGGSGRWVYTGADTYTGDTLVNAGTLALGAGGTLENSAVTVAGGATFAVTAAEAKSVSSIAVSGGAASLALADGAALTVGALSQSSGSLAVTAGTGASLVCSALAGTAPGWLTVNGSPAEFDASGRLKKQAYAITETIAARGDTVPNSASAVVGIASPGSGDADVLAADETAVDTLVQKTTVPAVVSLAEDRKLTVSTLAVDEDGSALAIGSVPGEGTLGVAGGTLTLDAANPDPDASVAVNAALDPSFAGKIEKKGPGEAAFRAPFAFAGELETTAGRVTLTNETALSLAATLTGGQPGVSEIRVDGSGELSFAHKNPDYDGDFVLNGGTVTLTKDDGTVTHFGSSAGTLVVSNGAAIVLGTAASQNLQMGGKKIRVSGHGPDGKGAIFSQEFFNRFLDGVTLDGDTTFGFGKGAVNPGYISFSPNAATPVFDMGGHTLTVKGAPDANGNPVAGYLVFQSRISIANAGRILMQNGTIGAYAETWLGDGDAEPIVLYPNAQLSPYGTKAQDRKWEIRGTAAKPSRFVFQTAVDPANTDRYRFNGDIAFAADGEPAVLRLGQNGAKFTPAWFNGKISGNGSLEIVNGFLGDIHVGGSENTFSGHLATTGSMYNAYHLHHPGSVPDYSKVGANTGRVVAYAGNWTAEQILSLANSAKLENNAVVAVNTSGAENQTAALALSDEKIAPVAQFGIGHDGPGRVEISGSWTEPVTLASWGGTLALVGDGERAAGTVMAAHPFLPAVDSEISIEGGVLNLGAKPFIAGQGQTTTNFGRVAKIRVANAKVVQPQDNSACPFPQISVGYGYEPGYMELGNGAEVSASMTLGHTHTGGTAAGMGAVRQKTGSKVLVRTQSGASHPRMYIANGPGTWAAYALEDGSFDSGQMEHVSMAYGMDSTALFSQTGGTANYGALCVGWGAYSSAHFRMESGTARAGVVQLPYVNWNGYGGRSVFTMEGGEFTVKAGSTVPIAQANPDSSKLPENNNGLDGNADYGTTTIVNLNGGTLHATKFSKHNTYNILPGKVHAYMNFGGGTLSANGNGELFGQEGWTFDRVTSFAGGAKIAVESGVTAKAYAPVSAPEGNGVASVAWTGTAASEFAYLGEPVVNIIGDGCGAAAVAAFDPASGKVTGVRIVSPGCNYTEAKAVIRAEALCSAKSVPSVWFTNTCVLTSSTPASGGLKKSGTGTLELHVPCTYKGVTEISGGTLKLMCDNAISASSELVLSGGTLDLNGKQAVFRSVGGAAGTVKGGTLSLSAAWTVDVAELAAGEYPVLTGDVSFAEGATVSFVNTGLLDKDHRGGYTFLSVDGTVANPPVADASLPWPWSIERSGNTFRLVYPHATVIILH